MDKLGRILVCTIAATDPCTYLSEICEMEGQKDSSPPPYILPGEATVSPAAIPESAAPRHVYSKREQLIGLSPPRSAVRHAVTAGGSETLTWAL